MSANQNTITFLEGFGEKVVLEAKRNLGASRQRKKYSYGDKRGVVGKYTGKIDSSGVLSNSLEYEVSNDGNKISFFYEDYGVFVDLGRRKGKGMPVKELQGWMKRKPIRIRDEGGRFVKATDKRLKAVGYLINRKLKYFGIDPTYFFTEPFDKATGRMIEGLTENMAIDIEKALADKFKELPGATVSEV